MSCDLMFIGHISIDHVQNLRGTRVQAGGAALYAAIAAKTLTRNIVLVSAIGKDYEFTDSLRLLNHAHVKRFNMPSTRFNIRYNKFEKAEYLKAAHGAGSRIRASAIPTRLLTAETMVHISPMRPSKVSKIVQKIRTGSPKTKISHNTWINYIRKSRRNRGTLKDLAQQIDFFMVNDTEAKALTQTDSIAAALRNLEAKRLIITLGQLGAIIKGANDEIQMVPALNVPVKKVVDTTGAGDTWCGAFVAAYQLTRDLMKSVTIASVVSSIKCSGWGLEKLAKLSFRRPDDVIEYVIGLKEGVLQRRMSDYART